MFLSLYLSYASPTPSCFLLSPLRHFRFLLSSYFLSLPHSLHTLFIPPISMSLYLSLSPSLSFSLSLFLSPYLSLSLYSPIFLSIIHSLTPTLTPSFRRAIEQEKVVYKDGFERLRILKPEIEYVRKVSTVNITFSTT